MIDSEFNKIPKFIKRLYREVSDRENNDIQWSKDGDKIVIRNKDHFVKHTLQKLSKTKEYSGFIRQLNIYGFIKIKSDKTEENEEYFNCYFKKDEPGLLENIRRIKKHEKAPIGLNQSDLESNIGYLTNSNYRLSNEITQLKERVDKQERTINGLLEILGKVFRTGVQNINENKGSKARSDFFISNLLTPQESDLSQNKISKIMNKDMRNIKRGDSLPGRIVEDEDTEDKNSRIINDMNDIFF